MNNQDLFLSLVRMGIGQEMPGIVFEPSRINWGALQALADKQGLLAVVLDGMGRLSSALRPQKKDVIQWIGEVIQSESVYEMQWKSACKVSLIFENNSIRTYILKGFVISECYPNPAHRKSVDLDCFLVPENGDFNAYESGNRLMENAGHEVDRSFYKNSTIYMSGLAVENHQFMTAVRGSKRLKSLERLLQNLLRNDCNPDWFEGTCMCRPPLMVSALFMIEHAYAHFLHEGMTWRHVLDWMMFSRKHQDQIDWYGFYSLIDKYGFRKFYDSYVRLGRYLLGELDETNLTVVDKRMLSDVWADLDLHETTKGFKGKVALASNTLRAGWKYKNFADISMLHDLILRVSGFLFERHPKI